MKRILFTTLLLLVAGSVFAQRGTLTAKLVDSVTGEDVPGAVVAVASVKTPDKIQYATSAYKGAISVPSLAYGEYTIQISYLGYDDYKSTFKVAGSKVDLGTIQFKPGLQIETVVKAVKSMRTSQKGDTVSYNAGSFKVAQDADVEGLLKKMPGITVTDGAVQAQGEDVKKVFVDGKEFFGDDVTTAVKSLPAEAVDRVEVYNKLSDAAEFSGVDDGQGYKALNIVTRPNMRQGQFGKFYAGYGYDADNGTKSKYVVGGNANIFKGDSRITVLGLFNNINQQNFSFEDILGVSGSTGGGGRGGRSGAGQYMVRPQSGVATVNAIGVNYSDTWGKRNQVSFLGSYFFNNTNTNNESTIDKWYQAPMPIDTLATNGDSRTLGNNHRFNARIEWKISDNQNLLIRPSFSYQGNDPYSLTQGWQYGAPNAEDPSKGGSGYSRTDNFRDAIQHGYNLGLSLVYRAKLGKDGRTITIDGDGRYSDNENNSNTWSNQLGVQPVRPSIDPETGEWDPTDYTQLRYLRNMAPSSSYSIRGRITYTEPISKYTQFNLRYAATYKHQERDKSSYITASDFSTEGLTPDPQLSNSYGSNYLTHNIGPGFRFAKNRSSLVGNVYYQRSMLDGQVLQSDSEQIRRNYDNVTYFLMGQLYINRENTLRLYVQSDTDEPNVTDLQSIYDLSDAQNISRGNPNLNPAYENSVRFHYVNSNVEKGRTFMWMFMFQNVSNYNATHVVNRPELNINGVSYTPNYYTMPVNLDSYRSLYTMMSYGFPIDFMKSNFNLMAGFQYSIIPSMLGGTVLGDGSIQGGERNDTQNLGYTGRAVLGSNISEKVDFTLSWSGTYNEATNSLDGNSSKNRYFNHTAQASMKFVLPLGFTITGSASYTQYIGFTNKYDDAYLLCNAWIGKKVFKNQRGEVMLGVNDILNQNKAFVRTVGSGWTQNAFNSVIGRYYMVQFTYNLRRFGKKGSTNIKDYDGMSQPSGQRRMMGPPPGGGHHR